MNFKNLLNPDKNNVLVIGDIMLDVYIFGDCKRISPEAPVPVIDYKYEEKMLGGAGNVFKNLQSLNINCDIITVVGDDQNSKIINNYFKKLKLKNSLILTDKKRKTTEKTRIVSSGQQLIRIDTENKEFIDYLLEKKIIDFINLNIKKYNAIIFSDYLKGVLTENICKEIIRLSKLNNILTLLDPKGENCLKYKNIDLIKPNLNEAEILSNKKIDSTKDLENCARELKNKFNCKFIVITLGEKGIAFFDDKFKIIKSKKIPVYDVSGAGDTVIATITKSLLNNYSLNESCKIANIAASIVIQKFGSQSTTIKEILNLIK